MKYISTRGRTDSLSFREAVLTGLAPDGGLLLPDTIPDATEKLADSVESQISEVANNQGLTITRRFSPGYCDWNVKQQKMVFQAMRGDCAGVSLTDSCLMIPRKSISGIIGIGPSEITKYNPCKTCDEYDCVGRR